MLVFYLFFQKLDNHEPDIKENILYYIQIQPDQEGELPDYSFNTYIKYLFLSSKIKRIRAGSLKYCGDLEMVFFLPTSRLETIGCLAFAHSYKLRYVSLENAHRLRLIENNAFFRTGLAGIDLPPNLKVIGEHAFTNCYYLTNFKIPEGVTQIERSILKRTSVKEVEIPDSMIDLDPTFLDGSNVEIVRLPRKFKDHLFLTKKMTVIYKD
jgi:hypothetical protein